MLLLFFQRKNMFIYVKLKKLVVPARDFTTYLARDLSSMTQDNLPPLRSVDCRALSTVEQWAAPLLTIPVLFPLVATAPPIATNLKKQKYKYNTYVQF